MTEQNKKSIDERWLDVLTGKEDLDVTGQFLDEAQLHVLEEAELLRAAIVSLEEKEQSIDIDLEKSKNKLIERLKKEKLL